MKFYDLPPGKDFYGCVSGAIELAKKEKDDVVLVFNGVPIIVRMDASIDDISKMAAQYTKALPKCCQWQPYTIFKGCKAK